VLKILQILSILALILASLVFGLCATHGLRDDPDVEQILASSAVEQFKQAGSNNIRDGRNEISPLVRQAEAFRDVSQSPSATQAQGGRSCDIQFETNDPGRQTSGTQT
jgi:hypothetical protein